MCKIKIIKKFIQHIFFLLKWIYLGEYYLCWCEVLKIDVYVILECLKPYIVFNFMKTSFLSFTLYFYFFYENLLKICTYANFIFAQWIIVIWLFHFNVRTFVTLSLICFVKYFNHYFFYHSLQYFRRFPVCNFRNS